MEIAKCRGLSAATERKILAALSRERTDLAFSISTLPHMLTPKEALEQILAEATLADAREEVSLREACGRVLAVEVRSDVDLPPFEKSAMDGYAVRLADFTAGEGEVELELVGESKAGEPFTGSVADGQCVAIYTGAEAPAGCDAVVMIEKTRGEGGRVWISDTPGPRQNICARGEDLSDGQVVFEAGRRLRPVDLSVLAAVGCDPVPVFRRPRVAILTTGDELIAPSEVPGPGQIREGNTLHLAAMASAAGASVVQVGRISDDVEVLAAAFEEALASCDALITTGGVSMGKYDLVGDALKRVGVEQIFHKIAIKPGKPVWFGRRADALVFGLPGNPVSCLVTHEVFVRPALARIGGCEAEVPERLAWGTWKGGETRSNPRQQNLPVRVEQSSEGCIELRSIEWNSSADVVALTTAEGLMVVSAGEKVRTGDVVRYRPLA